MIEVLKQMTEALEDITRLLQGITGGTFSKLDAAIQAGRQAIREHAMYEVQRLGQEIEQEPVAWMKPDVLCDRACMYLCTKGFTQFPECATTHPPQRTWQGLTIDEREQIQQECFGKVPHHVAFAHAVEAKLKEKNHD